MKKYSLLLLCSLLFFITLKAQWKYANFPFGGEVDCIARNGNTLYAGGLGGAFLSKDDGLNWNPLPSELQHIRVNCITIEGTDTYIGTADGIFFSSNNFATWGKINGLPVKTVLAIAIKGSVIYIGTSKGIYKSSDRGTTWEDLKLVLPTFSSVTSIHLLDKIIIAGTSNSGVYLSKDDGVNWKAANEGMGNVGTIKSLAIKNKDILCVFNSDLFYSTDTCEHWTLVNQPFGESPASVETRGDTIFVGTSNGAFCSTVNNGASWIDESNGMSGGYAVNDILIQGNTFYAATGNGVVTSIGGNNWKGINNGLSNMFLYTLFSHGNNIFAGSVHGGFVSKDKGNSWQPISMGIPNIMINNFDVKENTYFVATEQGIFSSSDTGYNWVERNNGLPIDRRVNCLLVNENTIYAGTFSDGMYVSNDNGYNWTRANTGLPSQQNMWAIAKKGTDVYVSTESGIGSSLFKTSDKGLHWTELKNAPGNFIRSILINGNTIYVAAGDGLYASGNDGVSWNRLSTGIPASTRFFSTAMINNSLFTGTDDQVYITADNGVNWSAVTTGLPKIGVYAFAVNGNNLFAGLAGRGVWYRPLSEMETGIVEPSNSVTVIYPNPSNGIITVLANSPNNQFEITNALGQCVYKTDNAANKSIIDLSNQSKGIYFLRMLTKEGVSESKKIIIQ